MPNEEKPDRRIAMIMAEMSYEPEPATEWTLDDNSTASSVWNRGPLGIDWAFPPPPERAPARSASELICGDGLRCPRCELSAFEVFPATPSGVVVACLGCPPPALRYELSVDVVWLRTRRYLCGRCGKESQVTMTLSEVNLHCRQCSQLTLHSIQEEPSPKVMASAVRASRQLLTTGRSVGKMRRLAELAGSETLLANAMPRLVEKMRDRLGLEDFDVFATKVRERNLKLRMEGNYIDWNRGTGRSWKGLLNALVECQLNETPTLWVKAVNAAHGTNLYMTALDWRNRLELTFPQNAVVPRDATMREKLSRGGWKDTTLYLDHSLDRIKFNPGITYIP